MSISTQEKRLKKKIYSSTQKLKKMKKAQLLKTQSEQSQSQDSTENTQQSNSELIRREKIGNTPFEFIQFEGKRGFVSLGMYRLTEDQFNDVDQAWRYIEENKWNLTLQIIGVSIENYNTKN